MKKFIIALLLCVPVAALMPGCTPDDRPELGDRVTDLKIVITPGEKPNTFVFTTSRADVIGNWTLGNGASASGVNAVTGEYPFAGDYTVTLSAYGSAGKTNTVSVTLNVPKSEFSLLTDPMYDLIAGGVNNPAGKTWVMDSMRTGHIAKNPHNNQIWNAGPLNKLGGGIYDDEATFKITNQDGPAYLYENHGSSLGAQCSATTLVYEQLRNDGAWQSSGYGKGSSAIGSDKEVLCTPPAGMTWSLIKDGAGTYYIAFPKLKNGNGGFLHYFIGWDANYEIRQISENRMILWKDCVDGAKRQVILITPGTPSNNDPIVWE